MAATGYTIKTATGDRGPFSTDQIRRLTTEGKLKPAIHVRDGRGRNVTVAEVLDGRAKIQAIAASASDIAIEDIPGLPSLIAAQAPAPSAGTGAARRAERNSSSRRPNQDRTASSRRAAGEGSGERSGRHVRRRQPVALYVAIAIALLGIGVLVLVARARPAAAPVASAPSAH